MVAFVSIQPIRLFYVLTPVWDKSTNIIKGNLSLRCSCTEYDTLCFLGKLELLDSPIDYDGDRSNFYYACVCHKQWELLHWLRVRWHTVLS